MGKKDITGLVVGRLAVLEPSGYLGKHSAWLCQCRCGNQKRVRTYLLTTNSTKSCGCMREFCHLKHGLNKTREHNIWANMRQRCKDPKATSYVRYGGRGVYVDPTWEDFRQFIVDMGPCPSDKHSIDRIDNSGPYTASNCRWASKEDQANNKRNSRFIVIEGEQLTVAQASRKFNIRYATLLKRLNSGWEPEQAVRA